MDDLIQQAFMHVEGIGDHVAAGHYDLIGPDGEIILPRIWEMVVQPDWAITMHMWPMAEEPKEEKDPKPPAPPPPIPTIPDPHPKKHKHGGGGVGLFPFGNDKKKKAHRKSMAGPPGGGPAVLADTNVATGPIVEVVPDGGVPPPKGANKKQQNRRSAGPSSFMMWASGTGMRKK